MSGFFTGEGYVGRVPGGTILFATEQEYLEYVEQLETPHSIVKLKKFDSGRR